MKYKDIYDDDFLKKFGEYREKVENLELKEPFIPDVKELAKACDITIRKRKDVREHFLEAKGRTIIISVIAKENIERFNIAKGIGLILMGAEETLEGLKEMEDRGLEK